MFTGIIQNLGTVKEICLRPKTSQLFFKFKKREKKVVLGESIAVNGCCLTANKINSAGFSADLLPETLQATNLGDLKKGDAVNLERSLRHGDSVGGHFVTGHVDAVGKILKIDKRGGNWSLLVEAPPTIISKIAVKGSIACDGISLTIQSIQNKSFRVAIIPHTLLETNLKSKKVGSLVNLEIDMLMRYLEQLGKKSKRPKISVKKLIQQGF